MSDTLIAILSSTFFLVLGIFLIMASYNGIDGDLSVGRVGKKFLAGVIELLFGSWFVIISIGILVISIVQKHGG